ncbi:MAG: amidase [Gemmatimonadetes bacterium]|nr:amidase family protein [Gemmatimonadota bacterium]MYA40889.1 amidase [Gemmatimonadota bacterium]MYE91942.1 amidase [Gemmatimonadota bacterium]MYJ11630.1 amidase [Gemmatimonadota bacterium]
MRPGALLFFLIVAACAGPSGGPQGDFEVAEASITDLQAALQEGRTTSVVLVEQYLARIAAYDRAGPALNTIIRLNPLAREQAAALDAERAAETVRGPMHGVPVLMKDNYDMDWMPTTGSSLALAGLRPVDNAFQVKRLLEAGAVILGKTNLHELAAGITTISSLGGQTRNPYDPARNPGGSSGGTGAAVAASFGAVAWGSDTCGSIRIPASVHNLFGLRPTKGLSSIDGMLPLSHSQDTGGPLARTVTDLAIALDATVGRDPADPATAILEGRETPNFQAALDQAALDGARIGVLEAWVPEQGSAGSVTRVIRDALAEMEALGATVLDVEIPEMDDLLANTGLIDFEFKFDLMDYLAGVPDAPVSSLEEILAAGLHHEALDGNFRRRNERTARDSPELDETLERRRALTAAVVDLLTRHDLDALAYPTMRQETALIGAAPTGATCFLSAHTGLPALTIPAGFTARGLPVGLELLGRSLDDARLVAFAFAYEAAHPKRRAPLRTPPLVNGTVPSPVQLATDPPSGDGLDAIMAVDLPTGTLSYRITISATDPADVYGTVLRRRAPEAEDENGGGATVVLRLGGPEEPEPTGAVQLPTRLLHDLMNGELELLVHTSRGFDHRSLTPRVRP